MDEVNTKTARPKKSRPKWDNVWRRVKLAATFALLVVTIVLLGRLTLAEHTKRVDLEKDLIRLEVQIQQLHQQEEALKAEGERLKMSALGQLP